MNKSIVSAAILVSLSIFAQGQVVAIRNVTVLPMTALGVELKNATVLIDKHRITSLNDSIPKGAKVIDGTNKYLIPGLIDMHVHIPYDIHFGEPRATQGANVFFNTQDNMTPFIANGVTTVLELNARPEHIAQRNEISGGMVVGPRIALAALINGGTGAGRVVNEAPDGKQAVRSAKAEGYEYIKVYSALDVATFKAIVEEANEQGMKVIGHIPNAFKGKTNEAFIPGFGMVAHAEELAKQADTFDEVTAKSLVQMMKDNGTCLSPTLTTMVRITQQARSLDSLRASKALQYVHPLLQSKWLTANNYNRNTNAEKVAGFQKIVDFNKLIVLSAKSASVPIVAGTDAGTSGVVWGFSLHDELEELVNAGLTPEEALMSATQLPAQWLGIDSIVGTIENGKYADLVLLQKDPRDNIRNTTDVLAVFVNGKHLSRAELDKMLAGLSKRFHARKNEFIWKKFADK